MARLHCPRCASRLRLPGYIRLALVRCPRCSLEFTVGATAQPPTAAPVIPRDTEEVVSAPPAPFQLTTPHLCHHCQQPLGSPIGRASATVTCPGCGNRTSAYAVRHRCSGCGAPLESPAAWSGRETSCPGCHERLVVPRDLLRTDMPDPQDGSWFGCTCPACMQELVAHPADVGVLAVCPRCLVPIAVPCWGHHLEQEGVAHRPDPVMAAHTSRDIACTRCGTRVPATFLRCPVCGNADL